MKKILSSFLIALLLSNLFVFNVFAAVNIDYTTFQIMINDGNNYTGDVEVKPGDKISLLLSGQNKGGLINNPSFNLSFSNTNFNYNNSGLATYIDGVEENTNIPNSNFQPGVNNSLKISNSADTNKYMDAYYVNLNINTNTPDTVLNINSYIGSDEGSSISISRNVFINSRPHILDYYYEKSGVKVNQIKRTGSDLIDLIVEIKDYNGCSNIDGANVKVNLNSLGLSSNEDMIFLSCTNNIALFKKGALATTVGVTDPENPIVINYNNFTVVDENGNSNLLNDSNTTFDNEDNNFNLLLDVVSAGTPNISGNINDDIVGNTTNNSFDLSFNGDQNGDYKIIVGGNSDCSTGNIIYDWTNYVLGDNISKNILSSELVVGNNDVKLCLRNDESKYGTKVFNVIKDLTTPVISEVSVGPANVVDQDSTINFTSSESGEYRIEKGGNGTINSGIFIGSGSVVLNNSNAINIINSSINIGSNDFYLYLIDDAENISSQLFNINKTTPPPSLENISISLIDNDEDLDGLDGRDISISWDNTDIVGYEFYETTRLYILPSNIDLDVTSHSYIDLIADKNIYAFTGSELLINDSLGNILLSDSNYKACIAIMGTNGLYSTPGCSNTVKLISDDVLHANVLSSKFTSDINLEITTDTLLDTNKSKHKANLVSFTINGNNFNGLSINSIDGKKINIKISPIGGTSIEGSNLLILTGSIRSSVGGYNDTLNVGIISDGQSPLIYNVLNNTNSIYNNFYSGSLDISFGFSEELNTETRLVFTRSSGNPDSENHIYYIGGSNLLGGIHNDNIDLSGLNLVSGTIYSAEILGNDLRGNFSKSSKINNIGFDIVGPDKVIQTSPILYSTLTPSLTWNTPVDNNGNGSSVKEYNIDLFSGLNCGGTVVYSINGITGNSVNTNELLNISDYSWKITGYDYMGNKGEQSDCLGFRVDTTVPIISNFEIKDTSINSLLYFISGDNIEVSSSVTGTDINHIWTDLSFLTGNNNTDELCSNPSVGINCTFTGGIVKYSFVSGLNLVDGVKQVNIKSQNTSGGNDVNQIFSITSDSNNPIIASGAFISPTGTIGGTGALIEWDGSKISDTIGIKKLTLEYSTGANSWINIGDSSNIGSFEWDLSSIDSGLDYKIKITATDYVGLVTSVISDIFQIDRTNPIVPDDTIGNLNNGGIFGGTGILSIDWDETLITDDNLLLNPISLYYSIDNEVTWIKIASDLENNGIFNWDISSINLTDAYIKITATDSVGNIASDISNQSFIIDTLSPVISFNYSSTPVNGSFINNSGFDISLVNEDLYSSGVYYSFQNITTGNYFNGTVFTGGLSFVELCSDTSNIGNSGLCDNLNFSVNGNIIDGNNYRFIVKSIDDAGNIGYSIPLDFIGDTISPNSVINTLSGTYFKDSIVIDGTSDDLGSGISSVKIQIIKDGKYWDGSNFIAGIQTLNTDSIDNYTSWNYDFSSNSNEGIYEVNIITYDKSFKVNNTTIKTISIFKDTSGPNITGNESLFTSPLLDDIFVGGTTINIDWNNTSITDSGSGLPTNFIDLEYFDGIVWNIITTNIENNGSHNWLTPLIDYSNIKLKIKATDNVGNISYQNSSSFVIDSIAPTVTRIETMDLDANGEIDGVNIIMSESIKDSTINLLDFNIVGIGNPTSIETGSSIDDNKFILKFNNSNSTSTIPTVEYVKGNLTDIAGKKLESVNVLSEDKAVPRILSSKILDNDENGKIDEIKIIFSETLTNTNDLTAWNINNLLIGSTISSISVTNNEVSLLLSEGTEFDTSIGLMNLDFISNFNWTDLTGNIAGSVSGFSINDEAKPIIVKSEYLDGNGNYKIDTIDVYLSEDITDFNSNDFVFSDLNIGSGNLSGSKISFIVNETLGDNNTFIDMSLDFSAGNLKDSSGNLGKEVIGLSLIDKVIPKLLEVTTLDENGNGKIDNIKLSYSEELNTDFSDFTVTVDGYNVESYFKGLNNEVLVRVTEKDFFDGTTTPLIDLTSNTTIGDLNANNLELFSLKQSIDKIGPVIVGSRYDEVNNTITIQFSEDIIENTLNNGSIDFNNFGAYSIVSVDNSSLTITLTGEVIEYGNSEISLIGNTVSDLLGNKQLGTYYTKIAPPIIINEIMLSTDSDNNYLELHNLSNSNIDISNYTVGNVTIPNGSTIAGNGYYVISKTGKNTSLINVEPDLISDLLDISGSYLILNNGIIDIDKANLNPVLFDINTPKSIERRFYIGDGTLLSSWYGAQASIGFDNTSVLGTPGSDNIFDSISPTITSFTPENNTLFPSGNLNITFDYNDNIGGLGIDINTQMMTIKKWDGANWGSNISNSVVSNGDTIITTQKAKYTARGLNFGKYKIDFSISDKGGNSTNETIIFYVDQFTFELNTNDIDLGQPISGINSFGEKELIITIKTVGAGFGIDMIQNKLLSGFGVDILNWNGVNGFGYEQDNGGYLGDISSVDNTEIITVNKTLNTDGNRNIYIYKFKYGVNIKSSQSAGYYDTNLDFNIKTRY